MSNFMNSIPVLRVKRAKFDLSYNHKTDIDMGQLIPIGSWKCLPNDKVHIGNQAVIRLQPLIAPLLHRIKVKVEAFFVPYRLIWDDWEEFITGGVDGTAAPSVPLWDDYYTAGTAPPKGSLWDYFARNTLAINDSNKDPDKEFVPNAFLRRAYNLVWNEYYMNRNVQSEVSLDNNDVLFRNWKNDYFVSALPFQQRGIDPAISLSFNDVPIVWSRENTPDLSSTLPLATNAGYGTLENSFKANLYNTSGASSIKNVPLYKDFALELANTGYGATVATPSKTTGFISPNIDGKKVKFTSKAWVNEQSGTSIVKNGSTLNGNALTDEEFAYVNKAWQTIGMRADNSGLASTFDANELRMLMQTKKYLERNARIGSRYMEHLLGRWSVFAGDARLQRPEFIYSSTNIIQIEDIPQTSATESGGTAQGHLAGKGTGAQINKGAVYTCKEHGIILQLLSLVPDLDYIPQGYDRETLVKNKYQLYAPEFAHLSEQMIKRGELYFAGNPATDNEQFGYVPIWSEYRHRRNVVSNNMRDTFDFWHLARKFANQPELNSDFVKIEGTSSTLKRIFESGTTIPGFIVAFGNFFTALRPLPKYGTPGLVDHF